MAIKRYIFEFTEETQLLNGRLMRLAKAEELNGWLWIESGAQPGDRALLSISETQADERGLCGRLAPELNAAQIARIIADELDRQELTKLTSYKAAKLLMRADEAFAALAYATSEKTLQRRVEAALAQPVQLSPTRQIQAKREIDGLRRVVVRISGFR